MGNVNPQKARDIIEVKYSDKLLKDKDFLSEMNNNIKKNDAYIIKEMIDIKIIDKIKQYLKNIGKNSLPKYEFLKENCPDSHRVHMLDKRSYVESIMHQFLFHPWNQNVFNLFDTMNSIYKLKNLSAGFKEDAFLQNTPKDNHIARLSFHNYPKGGGLIKKHSDPIGPHQLTVPILQMSQKGVDYDKGGLYIINQNEMVVDIDSTLNKGDVFFFQAEIIHGVAPIDPHKELDWLNFEGRWMMLASIIKTIADKNTQNAIQLED